MSSEATLEPDEIQRLRETMETAYDRRDFQTALETSSRILQHMPDDDDALYMQACCQYMLNQLDEALSACGRVLSVAPRHSLALQLSGKIYINLQQWESAFYYLKQALELDPEAATIHFNLAEAHYYSNDPNKSLKGWIKPTYVPGFVEAMSKAEQSVLKAMQLRPGNSSQHVLYALILNNLIREEEAQAQFREAIALDPMNSYAHSGYARLLYVQGRIKECRDHTEQALMLDANNEDAAIFADKLALFEKDPKSLYQELIRLQRTRARLTSTPAPFYMRIAKLMNEEGSNSPVKELRAYLKLVPDDLNAKLLFGQALYKDWRYFHAKRYFKKLGKHYPDNAYVEQWREKSKKVEFLDRYFLCPFAFFIVRPLGRFGEYIVVPSFLSVLWIMQWLKRRRGGVDA